MIPKLDRLLIRSFVGPFFVSFFVMLFVLVMQFFWVYMDDLIGKGFGLSIILQLLMYMSVTLIPMAMPLAVLLASLMTFGNMGEHYELIAVKSAGVSLLRIMRPLFIFMIGISGLAFVVSNNLIPVANLKARTMLYDLQNSKMSLSLREGRFNQEITGYAIRFGHKSKDGDTLHDVMIYDNSAALGNDKIVMAKYGQLIASPDNRFLIFRLIDGWRYEESSNGRNGNGGYTLTRMRFKKYDKVFDVSQVLKIRKTDENTMKNGQAMMNIAQLNEQMDTINKKIPYETVKFTKDVSAFYTIQEQADTFGKLLKSLKPQPTLTGSFLDNVPDSLRLATLEGVKAQLRSAKLYADISLKSIDLMDVNRAYINVEWHRKFALSLACLLLYLIGAPLGAIIRKGGLGLPLIVAVIFFVTYFIISKAGETISVERKVPPYFGMWISSIFLLPFAVIFIRAAKNDSKMFNTEWYKKVAGFFSVFKRKKSVA